MRQTRRASIDFENPYQRPALTALQKDVNTVEPELAGSRNFLIDGGYRGTRCATNMREFVVRDP